MKKTVLSISLFCFAINSFAQVTDAEANLKKQIPVDTTQGWKRGGTIGVNFAQSSLTNWAAGGQNSLSLNGIVSLFAHYHKGTSVWENYLDLGYGSIRQGKNANWRKTDDKIDFTSKYGKKAFSSWYYAGLLNFKTQMAPGYNYPNDSVVISNLLAPAYVIGAIGMDFKPNEHFTAFIAPFTSKTTIVNVQALADAGAFGVDKATYDTLGNKISDGKIIRSEFGGYIRLFYKRDIMQNVSFQTKVDLFSNYLHNPQNIDVSWDVLLSMKVNKFISATVSTNLLYDDDIKIAIDKNNDGIIDKKGPRTQFKEVLGVGFSYKF